MSYKLKVASCKFGIKKIIILLFLVLLIAPNFSFANQSLDPDFNQDYIISDFELENYTSMVLYKHFLSPNISKGINLGRAFSNSLIMLASFVY